MANDGRQLPTRKMLFARVGWMRFYSGPIPGDERPIGGGRYNQSKIGHEVYNFREANGKLYGYFQPSMQTHAIALERIDSTAGDKNVLRHTLVVFVAPRTNFGQVIVGWYKNAEVFREQVHHSPGKPKKFGHFCSAKAGDCVLLPDENRNFVIPFGKDGMGQSNICYTLNGDGSRKQAPWIQKAFDFIDDYQASDILSDPAAAAETQSAAATEEALAHAKGQGFARSPEQRQALEGHSMTAAMKYFSEKGFNVEDVSKRRSYDLLCRRGAKELHVEVKGTTTDGDVIVLTNNEVKHACDPTNSCVLFVLHSIRLKGKNASGGKRFILEPWELQQTHLTPVSYTYRVR